MTNLMFQSSGLGSALPHMATASAEKFLAQARLQESRDKSTWQNTGEIGVRFKLRNNLRFELGYSITGYLDAIILPSLIVVPETQDQINEGVTALYGTQDYDVEGWHAGMSFQF